MRLIFNWGIEMKRILFLLYFVPTILFAGGIETPRHEFSGFYVGANGGVARYADLEHVQVVPNSAASFSLTLRTNLRRYNYVAAASVYIHYGYQRNFFYFGAETGFNYADKRLGLFSDSYGKNPATLSAPGQQLRYRSKVTLDPVEFYADLMPGFVITPDTLLYGRIGLALNHLKFRYSINANNVGNGQHIPETFFARSQRVEGLRLGLGVRRYLSHHLYLSMDYIYTRYIGFTIPETLTLFVNPVAVGNGLRHSSVVDYVNSNTLLIGLLYNFSS